MLLCIIYARERIAGRGLIKCVESDGFISWRQPALASYSDSIVKYLP
jgi:hypothetical protein